MKVAARIHVMHNPVKYFKLYANDMKCLLEKNSKCFIA